jgi:acetylglutamate kinase
MYKQGGTKVNRQHYSLSIKDLLIINGLKSKTLLIKYGGSIMDNAPAQDAFIEDLLLLSSMGIKLVIVHGGGPEISRQLIKSGVESKFINGLRVTDKETIEVVEMVLSGKINKKLSSNLSKNGLTALGISGTDSNLIKVKKKLLYENGQKIDLGFVGEIININKEVLLKLIDSNIIPVISPIGSDDQGNSYNINADSAAAYISGAVNAEKLLIMTDVDGVYIDKNDPSTLIKSITVEEINKYTDSGVITGGMLPKLECCISALSAGTKSVHLIDGRVEHSLLSTLFHDKGTKIIFEREEMTCQKIV